MKYQRPQSPKINTHQYKYGASFAWAFTATLLVASSVAQASDMQIYAVPTAGKKTIVMMLDTSGSMSYSDTGQTGSRLTRLKNGMYAFLESNNPILTDVRVGLGNYSTGGDGQTGNILVPAAPLGDVSTLNTVGSQRYKLKLAVQNLTAYNGTPTAHAYAEAAAYLMGTTTYSETNYDIRKDSFIKRVKRSNNQTNYSYCTWYRNSDIDYTNLWQSCRSNSYWSNWDTSQPSGFGNGVQYDTDYNSTYNYYYYYVVETKTLYDSNSGMPSSKANDTTSNPGIVVDRTATNVNARYKSPLPAVADRVSCDGQGVYVLSDGAANSTSTNKATKIMSTALGLSLIHI